MKSGDSWVVLNLNQHCLMSFRRFQWDWPQWQPGSESLELSKFHKRSLLLRVGTGTPLKLESRLEQSIGCAPRLQGSTLFIKLTRINNNNVLSKALANFTACYCCHCLRVTWVERNSQRGWSRNFISFENRWTSARFKRLEIVIWAVQRGLGAFFWK